MGYKNNFYIAASSVMLSPVSGARTASGSFSGALPRVFTRLP